MLGTTGTSWPSTGKGLELNYRSDLNGGLLQAYDRGGSLWGTLDINASTVQVGGSPGNFNVGGSVGIGTTTHQTRLDISGAMLVASATTPPSPTSGSGLYLGYFGSSNQASISSYDWSSLQSRPMTINASTVTIGGNLSVSGTLSKGAGSFKIDHPLDPTNKYLYHSFVESPDMKNIYDGVATTDDDGFATITMPVWFEALNRDFRYQLTVIGTGTWARARVSREIESNRFTIETDVPNTKVSWQVTGIRKDAYANAHRIMVEEEKSSNDKGTCMHPEACVSR